MTARQSYALSSLVIAFTAQVVAAQDQRTVTQPTIPSTCSELRAQLVPANGGGLAAADENRLDTARIQAALDGCTSRGGAVLLRTDGSRTAFLSGPLDLRSGVTLVVGAGATLFASRNPRLYDLVPGKCGTVAADNTGCRALINGEMVDRAGVMGPGTIDGRGGAKLLGQTISWWDVSQQAKTAALSQNNPRLLSLDDCNQFTLYRVLLRNSPEWHVAYREGNGFTAWGVLINTTDTKALNTDGINPINSSNVTITNSYISAGDDQVAIKSVEGGSPSTHMTISHNHFYRGHGLSIGSETAAGVNTIRVTDLSIDGSDQGLRIKSNAGRGGLVTDVEYSDVCIRNNKRPIELNTHYTSTPVTTGELIPVYQNIRLKSSRVVGSGTVILGGYDASHLIDLHLDNVHFDSPSSITVQAEHTAITIGPGPMNLPISGSDVHVTGTGRSATTNPCTGKFVSMPGSP